ncbi:MAG: glutamate 5-kinase [Lachnospiraceae bacterium]|nr:glutamate 5-kinase [Lachnospiraceae bacterium]
MWQKTCYRLVIKVGTSTLTHLGGAMNLRKMEELVRVLADLQGYGHEVILVTSGAIAVGTRKLSLPERPKELRMKQAAAAVGQCSMMHIYDKLFAEYNRQVAQILLTGEDVENPVRAEHLSNTFEALLSMHIIPIVNENDSVSSAEIETGRHKVLGDNDTLSAIVAKLCHADQLILISDIDGLYERDPHKDPGAAKLEIVTDLTPEILEMAGGAGTAFGTGGMSTKLTAASIAMESGCDMIITDGANMNDLYRIVEGARIGTRFIGKKQ